MLLKAEYVFRPSQLLRRLYSSPGIKSGADIVVARLPWGRQIAVSPHDNIGPAVLTLGVYDLVVTETIWRLLDPEDTALDIGANIGCMTAAMAERASEVHSFEPHPLIHRELIDNIRRLQTQGIRGAVSAHPFAVGAVEGTLPLKIPEDFRRHRGESTLATSSPNTDSVSVRVVPLDSMFPPGRHIGLIKLDVEGFEYEVLRGASGLLSGGRVRDCIFEEHRRVPTDTTSLLQSHGYTIFRLARGLTRPRLLSYVSTEPRSTWEATSFLATRQPERAWSRMSSFGWRCLGR